METIMNLSKHLVMSDCMNKVTSSDFLPKIPIFSGNEITYEEFFTNYLMTNRPCLFSQDVTANWASRKDWVKPDGEINFDFLKNLYGDVSVSVTQIKDEMSMEYGGMECEDMKIKDYINYWIKYIENGYPSSMPCLYLKDWHIVKDSKKVDYKPYTTPIYFRSDWLNEISNYEDDDFRFAYMGPKGSWTPFHSDVYGSFSWSANVVGQKKWRLYPPGNERQFIQGNCQIKYDYKNPGVKDKDFIEIIQNAGEIIFVPSGWYHIVWNQTDTISINHNWLNGCNIYHVWNQLTQALEEVRVEIQDLSSMDGFFDQCQIILQANHGMDYSIFINMIERIWNSRQDSDYNVNKGLSPGQVLFDTNSIVHLIENHMLMNKDVENWSHILNKILKIKV